MKKLTLLFACAILLLGCNNDATKTEHPIIEEISIENIPFTRPNKTSVSNLVKGTNGKVYLTWVEAENDSLNVLYFSTLDGNTWNEPTKIAEGSNWIVNWADFPSLIQFGNNLAVNYLVKTDGESYTYDVYIKISNNGGKTWQNSFKPHTDNTNTEHGFVSMVVLSDTNFMAIWLDGRKYAENVEEMTLRSAIVHQNGNLEQEFVIDERVCDCCATDAVMTTNGLTVLYRDRDENEKRDMAIATFKNNEWTIPKPLAEDNWTIAGCPVNGPAVDVTKNRIIAAWFTAAKDSGLVKFASASSSNFIFGNITIINTQSTIGRVDVLALSDKLAVVSWIETENDQSYLKIRTVKTDETNQLGEPVTVSLIEKTEAAVFL